MGVPLGLPLVLLALAIALLVARGDFRVRDGDAVVPPPPAGSPSGATGGPATGTPGAAALAACREQIAAADRLLGAARPSVTSWTEHVRSRTDLLAGRMSADEASRIWRETRLAGEREMPAFQRALRDYRVTDDRCTQLDDDATAGAEGCRARGAAAARTVAAARQVMEDWHHHLRDMADFREGDVDSSVAQARWEHAWATAPQNLAKLRAAQGALDAAPTCDAP